MKTEINFNSVNDIAKFLERAMQDPGTAQVSLLTNGYWLLKTDISERDCKRVIENSDLETVAFVRI